MRKWVGKDLHNLLTLSNVELRELYPEYGNGSVERIARDYKTKLKKLTMEQSPERPEQLNKNEMIELFKGAGIDLPDNIIENATRVGFHVGYIRNADGEIEYTKPLPSVHFDRPTVDEAVFVSQAEPTVIYPTETRPRPSTNEKQALIVTDAQIWLLRDDNDVLHPAHDNNAIDVVLGISKEEQPDKIILVGDFLDFPSLSKFKQEKAFEDTLTASINEAHKILAKLRANNPNAEIALLEGNHEKRLSNFIYDRARQLYGLKRPGDELPILDIRNLLRLADLGIDYYGGYPNGRYWLNDRLKVVHGDTVKQLGKTVTNLIRNDDTSTITGHIHRFEMATRTIPSRFAGRLIIAASFGTLSRIDGAVPSAHSSLLDGQPTLHIEQWQQGAGMVTYREGDNPFNIEPITIHTFDNYYTHFRGKTYEISE